MQCEEEEEPLAVDAFHKRNPQRHKEVEPDEEDEEVKLVLRIAEKEQGSEGEGRWNADVVKPAVVQEEEERPDEIRDDDSA